jgi:ATP-dependent DNA helicase RecG
MTPRELSDILDELLKLPDETEWIEFKEAKTGFDFRELGQYFSALSNEANLKGRPCGWLIFGVEDETHRVVGSMYRPQRKDLDSLKHEVAKQTTGGITFVEVFEIPHADGRVVMFQIPPAPRGVPTAWQGHYYGRDGESLVALNLGELEQIRKQSAAEDWSAGIVENVTIADLDPAAIRKAREEFKKKNAGLASEVDRWDDATFLNKAKVCINGRVTRTGLILLGKPESEVMLSPARAQISWVLRDDKGVERDYAHFHPPLLVNTEAVFGKIRNLTYRYIKKTALFPDEVSRYDPWVIREALHNCVAHQDYSLQGRINVVEQDNHLLFTNVGSFLPKSVEAVIAQDSPPDVYRNQFLANAMVGLNMIDTIGSGIKRMFQKQRERLFPMPDYDLYEPQRVKVKITGKVLDENYAAVLLTQTELPLQTVIALDRVQKHYAISDVEAQTLRTAKLIEGRKPNYVVSARIAALTDTRAEYIKHRTLDKKHYKGLVVEYLKKFESAEKRDIEEFMLDKLSESLTVKQKRDFVRNLLQEMRREGAIRSDKPRRGAKWGLAHPPPENKA